MVDVLDPFAVIDVGEAARIDVAALDAPGVKVTTALSVIGTASIVPVIVVFPEIVGAVNVAV